MKKKINYSIDDLILQGKQKVDAREDYFEWYSWPQMFGSTAGPHGGIGGAACTNFQVFLFYNLEKHIGWMYCDGVWKEWDRGRGNRW